MNTGGKLTFHPMQSGNRLGQFTTRDVSEGAAVLKEKLDEIRKILRGKIDMRERGKSNAHTKCIKINTICKINLM